MKTLNSHQQELMNRIYDLILDKNISDKERDILRQAKVAIEKGGMFESHLINLRNQLLPLVVSQQISKRGLEFYKILRADRKISLGVGDSLLVGILRNQ
ncbi:MAG: bacteriocin immunity protein [Streptococcaceae bacterium]|jgi:hypothetical protein|nr:bacteriocin immunity protein [Streptococcaceae bacterium]